MQSSPECLRCFARQAVEAVGLCVADPARQGAILRRVTQELAATRRQDSPPKISQHVHRVIRRETGCPDPYRIVKDRMNRMAIALLPQCRERIAASADPRTTALRFAVAGNLLDSGAKCAAPSDDLPRLFSTVLENPLAGDPQVLFRTADQAKQILFLADNAGEIFFDRLLVEALPVARVTVAVRGGAVLNDALAEDATLAGLADIVPVIDNGSDAPGTVLEDCSAAFLHHFWNADLIVAKGQGNYETLSDVPAPVFFLFTVKCPLVAGHIGAPVGTMVASKSAAWTPRPPRPHGQVNQNSEAPDQADVQRRDKA